MKAFCLTLAVVILGLTGCNTYDVREGTHAPVYVPGPDTNVRHNNVSILDDSIGKKIAVQATNWRRTETGTVEAWASLRNRTDYRLQLECRTQFFGPDGAPVGKASGWKRLILGPNEINTYREFSTDSELGSYYIEVREGR